MSRAASRAVPVTFEVVTAVTAAPSVLFDLALDVDVHAASLAGSDERATTSTGRRCLQLGEEVTFAARHVGVRWRMTSRITAYERPWRFVDEQVRGPFALLRHEHRFEPLGPGRTRATDRMTIALAGGRAGGLVTRRVVAPYLRRLLRRRADHLRRVAESGTGGPGTPGRR